MSDAIFVVNVNQYIGESTYGEIDWAEKMKKEIYFLETPEVEKTDKENTEEVIESGEPSND